MSHTRRIAREYIAQSLSFALTIADRILIAGVLLRVWGVSGFELWSVASAAAGMVALFEFGLNLYFNNRITFAVEQGDAAAALRAYRAGNLLLGAAATIGFVTVSLSFPATSGESIRAGGLADAWMASTLLAATAAVRLGLSALFALYRAHRQYGRLTVLLSISDCVRILTTIGLGAAGVGLVTISAAILVVTILFCGVMIYLDARRRFPAFRYGLALPAAGERRNAFHISFGYWLQNGPNTLITFGPVLLLEQIAAAPGVISQFVLMRTLANFVRAALQVFAIVLGQECGRRIATRDAQGLFRTFREGTMVLGAQTALIAGLLIALGRSLFTAWTGKAQLFDPLLLAVAILPPALAPTLTLATNLLASANLPWLGATGRVAQLVLSVGLFWVLPISEPVLRLLTALAVGELAGFGVPVTWAMHRLAPGLNAAFYLEVMARTGAIGLIVWAASALVHAVGPSNLYANLFVCALVVAPVGLAAMLFLGVEASRRQAVLRPTFGAIRAAFGRG